MAKFKEIEVKWLGDHVPRADFNRKLKALLAQKEYMYRFIRVAGPDTYFSDHSGRTLRHRISRNTHELTAKMRIYKKSIMARKEVNVKLALDQPRPTPVLLAVNLPHQPGRSNHRRRQPCECP